MPEELECVNRATFKVHFNTFLKISFLIDLETHCYIPTTNTHYRWMNISEETREGDLFKTSPALFFIKLFFLSNTFNMSKVKVKNVFKLLIVRLVCPS